MSNLETHSFYDLSCPNTGEVCPVKQDIIGVATGDPSGQTEIDNELTERIVQMKLRERDRLARGMDCSDECPTPAIVDRMPVRRMALTLARKAFHRVNG